jgi:hypothetical protein
LTRSRTSLRFNRIGRLTIGNGNLTPSSPAIIEPGAPTITSGSLSIQIGTLTIGGMVTIDSGAQFAYQDLAASEGILSYGTALTVISTSAGLMGEFANLPDGGISSSVKAHFKLATIATAWS